MSAHMGIDVLAITLDLTAPDAPVELFQRTQAAHLDVELLINNAGFGAFGEFASIDRKRQRRMIDLNIAALVELAHLYLQPMTARHRGGVINIASVAGFAPLPYSALYAATKAFVLSFSQALYEEARQQGVHVMVVNPGSTETNFFQVAGRSPFSDPSRMQTSAQVVGESVASVRSPQGIDCHRHIESIAYDHHDAAAESMDYRSGGEGNAPRKGIDASNRVKRFFCRLGRGCQTIVPVSTLLSLTCDSFLTKATFS